VLKRTPVLTDLLAEGPTAQRLTEPSTQTLSMGILPSFCCLRSKLRPAESTASLCPPHVLRRVNRVSRAVHATRHMCVKHPEC